MTKDRKLFNYLNYSLIKKKTKQNKTKKQQQQHQASKTENRYNNIVKLQWIPIIGPKIRKGLRKGGCKVIFTSATKVKNKICKSKINTCLGVNELSCDCGRIHWRNKKTYSLGQLNIMKIA